MKRKHKIYRDEISHKNDNCPTYSEKETSGTSGIERTNGTNDLSTRQESSFKYAGFWIRLLAYHIDVVFLYIIRYPISLFFWLLSDDFTIWGGLRGRASNFGLDVLYSLINIGIWFAYFTVMVSKRQTTLGKMLLKLRVLGEDMNRVSLRRAFVREVFRFISWIPCGLGFIWAAFDPRKQAWHDKVAKTLVIRKSYSS